MVPVKKEVKATVSGIYITEVKGLHGKPIVAPPKEKLLQTGGGKSARKKRVQNPSNKRT